MNRVSLILFALVLIGITLFWSPKILAMNRGRILQTTALWLAIFLGVTLIYKNFGPDSPHPLFGLPDVMTRSVPPKPQ